MDDLRPSTARPAHGRQAKPWGLLLLLMALTSIGPTTLNLVVPALPEMANRLASDVATIQLTVSVYLLALAAGQLAMGPLSDRFGRRPVMLLGLTLTAAASVLAISVGTVGSLIAARVLQALGASAGIVVSRAIIRDLFDRNRAASMIGLVATVMVVVPTLGPLIGGLLDTAFGWESIFLFTAVTSAMVVAWAAIALPETRGLNAPPGAQQGFLRDLAGLARSAKFAGYVCAGAFGSSTFFAFLGGGPHVIITLMERSSAEYGVWFAISSIGYMAGNYGASRLSTRYGIDRMIWFGIGLEAIGVGMAALMAAFAHALGTDHRVRAADDHLVRQRPAAARRDRGRGQRAAAGGRHRRRHHRLLADGDRRGHHAICRYAACGIRHGGAAGDADGGAGRGAGDFVRAAGAASYFAPTSLNHSSSVSVATPCFLASASFEPAPGPATT